MDIIFDNSYAALPDVFYTRLNPKRVKQPELIKFNKQLAQDLGFTDLVDDAETLAQLFSGNKVATGAEPLAMVYAGHQFGGFSARLGDGRAILLGEVVAPDGERYDIQLKGSGPTPYSRGGDGRSALGPVLREYLVSEAMAKLGVPTTRALAAVTTGEQVARDSLVPGGILTRIARGFVRVGTFEYFSSQRNFEALKSLADYEIERHYPEVKQADNPYAQFLAEVVAAQAKLIAQWMGFGFIHGVMNTDNMSIAGETIDYGPCAFMDVFSHSQVFSSIDRDGRYAYNNQPEIGQWNLVRLAESLLPLLAGSVEPSDKEIKQSVSIAQDILNHYPEQYKAEWLSVFRRKLGLYQPENDDIGLINELLSCMQEGSADFTLTFYYLSQLNKHPNQDDQKLSDLFNNAKTLDTWLTKWRQRLAHETLDDAQRQAKMQQTNPVYIPRNHQIEAAIRAAEDHHDFSVFDALHAVLERPFEVQEGKESYMLPPRPEEVVHKTFCGT